MQYMILIYTEPDADSADMQEWSDYTEELRRSGAMVAGEALHPPAEAVTVRTRNGETTYTDGPFAETKEVLGGFYIVDVETAEEAKEWASKIPSTRYGSTEVRPVVDFSQVPT